MTDITKEDIEFARQHPVHVPAYKHEAILDLARAHLEAREASGELVADLQAIASTIHAAADRDPANAVKKVCTRAADALAARDAEIEELRSALERTHDRFERAISHRPIRDADETLAEARTALRKDTP